jgi:hypothetical protein
MAGLMLKKQQHALEAIVTCVAILQNKILTCLAILQNKILTCLAILQNKILTYLAILQTKIIHLFIAYIIIHK